jgi:P63C domain
MNTQTGRSKGGHARAAALSPLERQEIASRAASARWNEPVLKATHGSADHPLKIGDLEIPAYVLEDGRRVLVQRGMLTALDMKQGTAGRGGGDRIAKFVATKGISEFISNDLAEVIKRPIKFITSGGVAYGYEATLLTDLCDAVLAARNANKLNYQQEHIAAQCEILVRGLARTGIIALVDEVTGYQKDRAKDALARILEAFVAKELQPYVRTFPTDFYQEMFRLRGLDYTSDTPRRPKYFGMLTNDVVYKRLAPGVLDELKRITPKSDSGRPKQHLFRRLTSNVGYPKLREHLGSVVTMMKLSSNWHDFMHKLDRLHPKYGETLGLPLDYEQDDGRGL